MKQTFEKLLVKEEAKRVLQQVHVGNSNEQIKQQVMAENLLSKATIASRKNAWGLIEGRYLKNPHCPTKLVAQIVASQAMEEYKKGQVEEWPK